MDTEPKTLQQATVYFSDPDNCIRFLVGRRWLDGVVKCPICGSEGAKYLPAPRRVWQCKKRHPRSQFSIKVGTIFEDSAVTLDKWLMAMWMVANCKNGVSSWELHRTLGVTQKTAWFMLHRIRLAMDNQPFSKFGGPDSGSVEVDETYVGGRIRNMHRSKVREKFKGLPTAGNSPATKTPVMGMRDRETRRVLAKVIPNANRETLQNMILANVEKKSMVYTDQWRGYENLAARDFIHETVNHMEEYVRGQVHTQGIENFWSLLKRGLKGTYVAVEPFHLDRYLGEQVFRYNNRATKDNPLTDSDRFHLAVAQIVGKRLTYAELTGKELKKPEAN
jgi:transposase-like protein